ncbi:WXG100 family type VII secretion target [Actinomycetospora sp. OC33-EN08]|uniref:ESAT-6-like protein n=1 Tax=Actinomycetospora aurantiaca TaxID=3129233 RepID=A0ABU8MGH7_9PSEU
MSMVKVTSEQLADLGAQLQQGSAQVEEQLATMRARVAPLVGGEWEGAASAQFQMSWEQWAQSAARLREALDSISTTLTHAASTYQQAEDAVRSSVTAY